jgi:pectin methylesterase-like acyl-CoA thioesterase
VSDNTDADLAGYVVSRATSSGGTYTPLTATPVSGSTFTDTGAPAGRTLYYRVAAVDRSGNTSADASASAAVADTVAPAAPTGLAAEGTPEGIRLTWEPNGETDLAGYLVSRVDPEGGEPRLLTTTPLAAATFLDGEAPADAPSTYEVVAVDGSGNRSPAATAQAVPADTVAPVAPRDLTATGTDTEVTLTWTGNTEADLAGYLVYGLDEEGGNPSALTTTPITEARFVDLTAPAGVLSHYEVKAVDTAGNLSASATASATRTVAYAPIEGADVTVAADGSGDHTTVAAALAAAAADGRIPWRVAVKAGTYREVLSLARPNVTLVGATGNAADVVLTYDNSAGTPKPDGSGTYGTSGSATVLVKGNDVTVRDLTIENSYVETGTGSEQAVALKTTGDRLVFDNVRLLGDQDTLYVDSPAFGTPARAYFVDSYVEGDVDFVFGRGTAVFDRTTLKAATRGSTTNNGYVTAASTHTDTRYGFLITDSTIESDAPADTFHLGRPWQPSGNTAAVAHRRLEPHRRAGPRPGRRRGAGRTLGPHRHRR